MPSGTGTYGKKVGRPAKKTPPKRAREMPHTDEQAEEAIKALKAKAKAKAKKKKKRRPMA